MVAVEKRTTSMMPKIAKGGDASSELQPVNRGTVDVLYFGRARFPLAPRDSRLQVNSRGVYAPPPGGGYPPCQPTSEQGPSRQGGGSKGYPPGPPKSPIQPSGRVAAPCARGEVGRRENARANVRAVAGRMRRVSVSVPPSPDHSANHSMHTSICAGMALHTQSSTVYTVYIYELSRLTRHRRELLHTLHTIQYAALAASTVYS